MTNTDRFTQAAYELRKAQKEYIARVVANSPELGKRFRDLNEERRSLYHLDGRTDVTEPERQQAIRRLRELEEAEIELRNEAFVTGLIERLFPDIIVRLSNAWQQVDKYIGIPDNAGRIEHE